jgi:hypothetical protein
MKMLIRFLFATFGGLVLVSLFRFLIVLFIFLFFNNKLTPTFTLLISYFVFITVRGYYIMAIIIMLYYLLFPKNNSIKWMFNKIIFGVIAASIFSYFLARHIPSVFPFLTWYNLFLSCTLSAITLIVIAETKLRSAPLLFSTLSD